MSGEAFEGRASDMKQSDWLAVEDIADVAPLTVAIESVVHHNNVAFEAGRKEPHVYALKFKGAHKQLPLNATNRKTLQKAFTNDTKQWQGKRLQLTIEPLKRVFNGHTHGIRVKVDA